MFTSYFRSVVAFVLVSSVLVLGTGCGAMNASSGGHAGSIDSRVAHFDRESRDRTFF